MKSKKNLVFLGMMGSGKTSIGLIVSKKLNINFIDTDKEIEKEVGMKISKIFEIEGENFFRKLEEQMTLKILKKNSSVISLGGGAFLNENIKREVLKNHISFWLNWKSLTLIKRIIKSKKRPIAFNSSEINLKRMINERTIFYSEAKFKINCETLTKNMIVKNIIELYGKNYNKSQN
jgi:shikimate kinase